MLMMPALRIRLPFSSRPSKCGGEAGLIGVQLPGTDCGRPRHLDHRGRRPDASAWPVGKQSSAMPRGGDILADQPGLDRKAGGLATPRAARHASNALGAGLGRVGSLRTRVRCLTVTPRCASPSTPSPATSRIAPVLGFGERNARRCSSPPSRYRPFACSLPDLLRRFLEVSQVRRLLPLLGRHQIAVGAQSCSSACRCAHARCPPSRSTRTRTTGPGFADVVLDHLPGDARGA